MSGRNQPWKKWIRWGLTGILVVDVFLLVVAYRAAHRGEQQQIVNRDILREQHQELSADVTRVRNIRERLPQVQGECDKFTREHLRQASGGYSVVLADLGDIADKAGLRTSNISFRQAPQRNQPDIVGIAISASVEGDYSNLVRFINGLEKSPNFYLLENLTLASSTGSGAVRLNLELRTYFRLSS